VRNRTQFEANQIDPRGMWQLVDEKAGFEVIFDDDVKLVVLRRGAPRTPEIAALINPPRCLVRPVRVQGLSEVAYPPNEAAADDHPGRPRDRVAGR
jgi:hypothetical protein